VPAIILSTVVNVKFYIKQGCWLCDAAEDILNGLRQRHDLRIMKVDIAADEELYELYRFDVPVLEFRDGSVLHGRIRKEKLLEAIDGNKE
jgi:hypothetical protein